MNDVRFYDFEFNRLAEFSRVISLNFIKKYCGYGTAEVHFPVSEQGVLELLETNKNLMFVSGENVSVVTGWKIGEDIAVFGRTPEWLLTKRGMTPFSRVQMSAEDMVRDIVTECAGDFTVLGETVGNGTLQDYSTDCVRVLHDVICDLLEPEGLGFVLEADIKAKAFVFRVISGNEKRVLFSLSNRTAYNQVYLVEKQNSVSGSGWCECKYSDMGEWDARKNSPVLRSENEQNFYTYYKIVTPYENRFGLNCVAGEYIFCDNREGIWKTSETRPSTGWVYKANENLSGAGRWDAVLDGVKTVTEAEKEISRLTVRESSSVETCHVEYGEDYGLGDVVTVQTEFGNLKKAEKKRVVSVNIFYDIDRSGVVPVFNRLEEI